MVRSLGEVAEHHPTGKPLVACLMGEASLSAAFAAAHAHQIPAYTFPEEASAALGALHQRGRWLASVHPTPSMPEGMDAATCPVIARRREGHTVVGRSTR